MMSLNGALVVEQALRLIGAPPRDLVAIVGPTASGKTALAVELAARLGGEIIGADSVQVYRGFDIGSGKPTIEELARAPHHLVGMLDPRDPIDAFSWANQAAAAIETVLARGRLPIVCGGTFLWVRALLYGLAATPGAAPAIRARHDEIVERDGRPALHAMLRAVDPDAAARLHPNDRIRVSRALEVHELTGKPMSAWQREHGFAQARVRARLLAVATDPSELARRIESRARDWLASGWIEEVESLMAAGHGQARGMASVGYAQIRAMLEGALTREALPDAITRATRVFARRQRTWLNRADVVWLR